MPDRISQTNNHKDPDDLLINLAKHRLELDWFAFQIAKLEDDYRLRAKSAMEYLCMPPENFPAAPQPYSRTQSRV